MSTDWMWCYENPKEAAAAMDAASTRIAELERGLKPFAQLLWDWTDKEIEPGGMWRVVPDVEDADFVGKDVLRARELVRHLLPST